MYNGENAVSSVVDFPDSLVGKESTWNSGSLIPGSGRSTGEGIGYPFQYSWASLAAQLVTNLPAMQDTWVWSLGWEDPLEKGKATPQSSDLEICQTWLSGFHLSNLLLGQEKNKSIFLRSQHLRD